MGATATMAPIIRRVLGDVTGGGVLAVLVALVQVVPDTVTMLQFKNGFLLDYVPLVIAGYFAWLKMEKLGSPRWLLQALASVGVGAVFFAMDVAFGMSENPSQPIFSAATSTGLMFGITLLVCPGYTFIALAGWTRSLVIHLGAKSPV